MNLESISVEFYRPFYPSMLFFVTHTSTLIVSQLINTEQALTACQGELESKTRQCQAAECQVEKLTDELVPLRQKVSSQDADKWVLECLISQLN